MQRGWDGWGCRRQINQIFYDINSLEEEKDKFLRYLKNNQFIFLEESLSKSNEREDWRNKKELVYQRVLYFYIRSLDFNDK